MKRFIHKLSTTLLIFTLLTNQVAPTFAYAQEISQPTTVETSNTETSETPAVETTVSTENTTSEANEAAATGALGVNAQIGQVKVTATNSTGSDEQYTTKNRQGDVQLDGSLVSESIVGGYIEFTYPTEYIEKFTVATGGPVMSVDNSTPGLLKVYLSDITQTTTASFPFTFKFKDRVTPEGYTFSPKIVLKDSTGNTLKEVTDSLIYKVKVDKQSLFKYNGTNTTQAYTIDNREIYGGKATGEAITKASDVTFQFSLSTNTLGGGQTQNWGNGKAQTRAAKTITITDTLPTYEKADGTTGTAVFDPAKNPGWTLNADGTVSKTITGSDTLNDTNSEAELALREERLVLSFPNAKTKTNIVNNAKTVLTFIQHGESEPKLTVSDDIQFKLIGQLISDSSFRKSNNDKQTLNVDAGAPDTSVATWILGFTNTSPSTISKLTLVDEDLDERMYFYSVGSPVSNAPFDMDVYGVKADGTEVKLGSIAKGSKQIVIVDEDAYNKVTNQAKQIYTGTLKKDAYQKVNRTYDSIKIKLQDGKVLQAGEITSTFIQTKLLNPFDETERKEPVRYNNSMHAEGLVDGYGEDGKFSTNKSESYEDVKVKEEEIRIAKITRSNPTGDLGEVVEYSVTADFSNLSVNRRVNGAQVIDVLPEGITYEGYYIDKKEHRNMVKGEPRVVENYNGSGRQAVIFELKDLDFYNDQTIGRDFTAIVSATITKEAMPTAVQTADDYKKNTDNHVFLVAKEFSPLASNVTSQTMLDNVFKIKTPDGKVPDRIVAAKSSTIVNLPTEIRSEKFISTKDGSWTQNMVQQNYGQEYKYQLQTKNYSTYDIETFTLYDRLPYAGDQNGSGFTPVLTKALNVESKYTVYYHTSTSLPNSPYDATQASGWVTADQIADFTKVTAIKVVLNKGEKIVPGEVVNFVVEMKTPEYTDGATDTLTATNVFYTNRNAENPSVFGETNTVSNQLPQYIPVAKVWSGEKDASISSIKVELSSKSNPDVVLATIVLNNANDWKGIFKLTIDGKTLDPTVTDYQVKEVIEENYGKDYETVITGEGSQKEGFTITNTRKTTTHTVKKGWEDNDNKLGLRKAIKVQLKQNGENYGEAIELSEENHWEHTFTDLPASSNGVAYEYTVEELDVPEGYTHEVVTKGTNSVITNRILSAIKQDLTFKKELEGRDLVEGEFTFNLLDENGNVIQTAKNAADGSITFKDVAFEKAGTYNYSVVEVSGDDAQITYDKSVKKVSIEVKQEDKAYVATVTYDADTTFKNKYTAPVVPTPKPSKPQKDLPNTDTSSLVVPTPEPSKPQKDLPNTGTSSLVSTMFIATLLVMIALGFVYTSKKEN